MHKLTFILLVVGGLNWLLVGLGDFAGANWNVVNLIFGGWPSIEALVYVLVGLSALYEIFTHKANCKGCQAGGAM